MIVGQIEITKEHFKSFIKTQIAGYQVFDPRGIKASGLSKTTYQAVAEHYNELAIEYKGAYEDMLERTYDEKSR